MAPRGYRTVSVSCHTPIHRWQHLGHSDHERFKKAVVREIRRAIEEFFPQMKNIHPVVERGATPKTWEKRTNRSEGRVGGIPFDYRNLRYGYPTGITPFPGLVRVGDTVFPGQSVVAVAWGARRIALRLMRQLSRK
jgi:phytoene dehydrogenase-like protein